MRDIVLIPTFCRPEYLTLCLEHLSATVGGRDKVVLVCHDRHNNDLPYVQKEIELTEQVVSLFQGHFEELSLQIRAPHPYIGNPYNFLEMYKAAYALDPKYIYLVEDDVLVAPDFFKWHEAAQARGDYFVTVGWHCIRNTEVRPSKDPTAYIESTRDFSSIGICWKRDKLSAFIKHATPDYYRQMARYLARAFPGSPIPTGQWTEQAGVVTRLLHETKNRWVAWPALPRVAHVGISGYHRPDGYRFSGPIKQRVSDLRNVVRDGKALNSLSKDSFDDVGALSYIPEWNVEDMHVVQRFEYQPGKI